MKANAAQESADWMAARAGCFTASRASDLMAKTKTGPSASRGNLLTLLAVERLTGQCVETYQNAAMAEKCLARAIELLPKNPYYFYFHGIAQENLGKLDLARASYAKAVETDDPKNPNPVFQQALAHLDAAAAAAKP